VAKAMAFAKEGVGPATQNPLFLSPNPPIVPRMARDMHIPSTPSAIRGLLPRALLLLSRL